MNRKPTPASSSISAARSRSGGLFPRGFVRAGGNVFFTARAQGLGVELWKSDGTTAGTVPVRDILEGNASPSIRELTACGTRVFFQARAGTALAVGPELWVSDGTAGGTRVIEVHPGSAGSFPTDLECLAGGVVFRARVSGDTELWYSDGTQAGTKLLRNINPRVFESSTPSSMKADSAGKVVYFAADDGTHGSELWKTDGTTAGTVLVKDLNPGSSGSRPTYFVPLGTKMVFRANGGNGTELWVTDGTAAGTQELKDIYPGSRSSSPDLSSSPYARIGNKLYFTATDGTRGIELWETDGTPAGTKLAVDLWPGAFSGRPAGLTASGSTLYFFGARSATERGLFALAAGSVRVVRLGPVASSSAAPVDLGGGKILFGAFSSAGNEPWISDGTTAGTKMLQDLVPGSSSSSPVLFTTVSPGRVLFRATTPAAGSELMVTDGTAAGTKLVRDILVDPGSSLPKNLTSAFGETLYMSANAGSGYEPWVVDPNGKCTMLDVRRGVFGSSARDFTPCWTSGKGWVFFVADDGVHGAELYKTDGTAAGTGLVKDVYAGRSSSSPTRLVAAGDKLFFFPYVPGLGRELWVSDGTAAGTRLVKDLVAGSGSPILRDAVAFHGKLYFVFRDRSGFRLWTSDGTAAGTRIVSGIDQPEALTPAGDWLVFHGSVSRRRQLFAFDGASGFRSFQGRVDATADVVWNARLGLVFYPASDSSGVNLFVADPQANTSRRVLTSVSGSTFPRNLASCDDRVFFSASTTDRKFGEELWISDGTNAGTRMVKDIRPGPFGSAPKDLVAVGDRVYFTASDGSSGRELWTSDGTAAGTVRVCDPLPGLPTSDPAQLVLCAGKLYFVAFDAAKGRELLVVDRPGASTEVLGEGCAPSFPTLTASPPELGGTMVLASRGGPSGHVGFVVGGATVARPTGLPFSAPCPAWIDVGNLLVPIGGPSAASSFQRSLPIPNQASLAGGSLAFQTLWLSSTTLFPAKGSNGVRITVGR